jgi:hypothetical protein
MALRKRRNRKGPANKKAAGTSKPRRRPVGKGHNKPPEDPPPKPTVPPISSWHIDDQSGAQIARALAARQRAFVATIGTGTVTPPFTPTPDPPTLHAEMLRRVAALEEATARLLASGEARLKPRPLDDADLDEIKSEIETLRQLPPVPAKPPPEAVRAQGKLAKFAEAVSQRLAADAIREGAKTLWTDHHEKLIAAVRAIAEWVASLT